MSAITDEQIMDALPGVAPWAVRALLDQQRASDAARIAELEADIRTGETAMRIVQSESVKQEARAEAAEAERDALRKLVRDAPVDTATDHGQRWLIGRRAALSGEDA
jgi:hypothetical protein